MALLLKSAIPVWVVCALCAIAIGVFVPRADQLTFLPVALGFCVLLTLCVQLAVRVAAGYIVRVAVTAAGAIVILAAATAVLAPIALTAG